MGVRDLSSIIKRYAPSCLQPITLSSLSHKTVAIDGNLMTTKFHFVNPSDPRRHLSGWTRLVKALRRENVGMVVVFDGETRLKAKERENAKRTARRLQQVARGLAEEKRGERLGGLLSAVRSEEEKEREKRLRELFEVFKGDEGNAVYSRSQKLVEVDEGRFFAMAMSPQGKEVLIGEGVEGWDSEKTLMELAMRSLKLEKSHKSRGLALDANAIPESIDLLQRLRVPVLRPASDLPHEAEGICSTLHSLGQVSYVITEDTDVALYGAPMIRNFSTSSDYWRAKEGGKKPMEVLDPVVLRECLGFSREEMVDFGLLLGTDFTERVTGVGPVKALSLIDEHGSIEAALESSTSFRQLFDKSGLDAEDYQRRIDAARAIFLNLPPLPPSVQHVDLSITPLPASALDIDDTKEQVDVSVQDGVMVLETWSSSDIDVGEGMEDGEGSSVEAWRDGTFVGANMVEEEREEDGVWRKVGQLRLEDEEGAVDQRALEMAERWV